MNPKIILASQSPQRQKLLASLGIEFEVFPADIDEKAVIFSDLKTRAEKIATAKAKKVAQDRPGAIILAADTFTVLDQRVFEKPSSLAEAKLMLHSLSGQTIQDHTGLCFIDPARKLVKIQTVITLASFRKISDLEIDRYVANNPVLTWAGGFSPAYHEGMGLIAEVHGSLTCLTHGLPLEKVTEFLIESGVSF